MIELHNCDCIDILCSDKLKNHKICIVTDPPFNINYHYNTYKDNMNEEEYIEWLSNLLTIRGYPFVVIHYPETIYKISFQAGLFPTKIISWVYNSNTARQHRDIAFFGITPDMSKVKQPYKNQNDKRIKERIEKGIGGGRLYDWWYINQTKNVSKQINHPCVMPLEVMKRIIGIIPEDYTILDIFTGSGTTGVACRELNRDFIGCEIDSKYYDIAYNRLFNNVNIKGETCLFE